MSVLKQATGDDWIAYNADCIEVMRQLPSESIGFSIFSPPYMSLYCYSPSERDIGNCATDDEFWGHFGFVIDELMRLTKPGRIVAVDAMNVPAMKERDGYIGIKDFRGDLIRQFTARGFIFHSEHVCWKDPLVEATRSKAIGLMHKQLCKDSAMCRAGLAQFLLAFRKPGKNEDPIDHPNGLETFVGEDPPTTGNLAHERWRRYASPVWTDIDFGRTLNYRIARDGDDERHISPLALDMIERGMTLWSKPGDVVLSPFMGIGSEGYVALQMGRKFVGAELKASYWSTAVKHLRDACKQTSLFSEFEAAAQ